jgi:hypothetical protein
LNEILKNLQTHQIKGKVLPPYLTKGGQSPPPRTFKASREVKKVEAGRKVQKKKGGENKCGGKSY